MAEGKIVLRGDVAAWGVVDVSPMVAPQVQSPELLEMLARSVRLVGQVLQREQISERWRDRLEQYTSEAEDMVEKYKSSIEKEK